MTPAPPPGPGGIPPHYPGPPQLGGPSAPYQVPPPKKSSFWKRFLLIALILLLIRTAEFGYDVWDRMRNGIDMPAASAADTRSVGIITTEPTCKSALEAIDDMRKVLKSTAGKDSLSVREQLDVGSLLARITRMSRETPNRVVRELYEQALAHIQASGGDLSEDQLQYANYAMGSAMNTVLTICGAIDSGAASFASKSAPADSTPEGFAPAAPAENTSKIPALMATPDPSCGRFVAVLQPDSGPTLSVLPPLGFDTSVPRGQWTTDDLTAVIDAVPQMSAVESELLTVSKTATEPAVRDFADLALAYLSPFILQLPRHDPANAMLFDTADSAAGLLYYGCRYAAGQPK